MAPALGDPYDAAPIRHDDMGGTYDAALRRRRDAMTGRISMWMAAGLALALVGCQAKKTDEGVQVNVKTKGAEDAAHKAGDAMGNAADKAGDAASDAAAKTAAEATEVEVRAAIGMDPTITLSQIDVDSDAATKTIYLKGTVSTDAQKAAAEAAARSKAEGYTIVNQITVSAAAGPSH